MTERTEEIAVFDNGLRFYVREGTTDWNTVYACGVEDEYEIAGENLDGLLVFDFGAHIGGFTILAASKGARVIAVEPVPDNATLVAANALLNGVAARVTVFRMAAGADKIWFNRGTSDSDRAHAFIGSTEDPGEAGASSADIETITLDALCDQFGTPDVLKLDCEGGEWAILQETAIAEIPLIVGEWHPTSGHCWEDVYNALRGTHEVFSSGPVAGPGGFRAELRL